MRDSSVSWCCLRAGLVSVLSAVVSVLLLAFFMLYSPAVERVSVEVGGNYTVTLYEDGFNSFWTQSLGLSLEGDTANTILEDSLFYRAPCKDITTVAQLLPSESHANISFVSERLGLNYHGSSDPVYSAAGGSLNYMFHATSIFDSATCFHIHLFDKQEAFIGFMDKGSTAGSLLNTGCLGSGKNHADVSIPLGVSAFYYVAASVYTESSQPFFLNYTITPELQVYNITFTTSNTCADNHDHKDSSCMLPLSAHPSLLEPNVCVYCQSGPYTNLSFVTNKRTLNAGALLFLALAIVFITFSTLCCGAYAALTKCRQVPVVMGKVCMSSGFSWDQHQVCI